MKKLVKAAIILAVFLILLASAPLTAGAEEPTHTVALFDRGDLIAECEVTDGTTFVPPVSPTREGYKLVGWREGSVDGALFDLGAPITSDLELHAAYELLPPSFEISSLAFTYDGAPRRLEFASVTHPLLDGGILSYEWYKNGDSLNAYGSSLSVTSVEDSGEYTCRLVFSVGGDVAEITTPILTVSILKCEIPLPVIDAVYYTGDAQIPTLYDNGYYTVDRSAHTLAGTYPIALTLTDPDNYTFPLTDKPTATVDFTILPAENFWVVPPSVPDVYTSFSPSATAMPRFGTPSFFYSKDGVVYTGEPPIAPGEYLMRAEVEATENYSALVSSPVSFNVIAESVVGIAVKTPADVMSYRAFEEFDPVGLTVGVTYNSGRYETVGPEALTFLYQQADSFRYRDSGVIITYGGSSVLLRTEVLRADYDISSIILSDSALVYNGKLITSSYVGELPIGLDGIPLTATLTGGGVDVGTYTVTLTFATESDNYNRPRALTATLTVLPFEAAVVWSDLSFVYDGTMKLPCAYYLDVWGRKIPLTPTGARSYAGQYTASVTSPDSNYTFSNPTVDFEILKADYDMSGAAWVGGGIAYNGAEHSVTLTNLPNGVTVIGYVNNKAVSAGEYIATAALSYDSANYNEPVVPDYTWRILPAEYPTDGFEFSDNTVTYDGEAHYPIFSGEMPVGLDGVPLEYTFSSSAAHVIDGRVAVEIIFTTESTNYTVPDSIVRYVEITPRDIAVRWENLEFCYTGATLLPSATAAECSVTVLGDGINAGEYIATAVSDNPDYRVSNSTCAYVILKADNAWVGALVVPDVFFGRTPAPSASALAGEVTYTYYTDPDCTLPFDGTPSSVGRYYAVAYSAGDANHEPITSAPVTFEIIAIIPVTLEITLTQESFVALDAVTFTACLVNNDGSVTSLDQSLVSVRYQTADSLRFGDTAVSFYYGELGTTAAVSVVRRDYDMSGACWSPSFFVYDGTEHTVALTGLPQGVTVREYVGNGFVGAGQYTVSAVLDYDTVNYNAPSLPAHTVTVEKQTVPLPSVPTAEYCGAPNAAAVPASELYYVVSLPSPTSSGAYPITLILTDPDNYTFGSSDSATVYFVVERRPITVTVSDFDLYLFESEISPDFEITSGILVIGDTLTPSFRVSDGLIYADFNSPDYDVTVIPGALNRHSTLSERAMSTLLFIILIVLIVLLILIAILTNCRRIVCACRSYIARVDSSSDKPEDPPEPEAPTAPEPEPEPDPTPTPDPEPPVEEPEPVADIADVATVVNVEYADTAITNALAKDLIRRDEDVVTNGKRRGIVNVDTLSRSFSAGERVDINALKSRSLVPYDTAYIKVLARGMIDKPLYVYANDFSLSAVKMIALTGGKAVKVNTVIKGK